MAVITRASLPEEFYDITSAQLLVQPEPQYLHAMLAKSALAAELSTPGAIGFMAGRTSGASGADYAPLSDGRLALDSGFERDAIMAIAGLGSAPGHTIRMNRPRFTDSTYTQAAREVTSGSTISVTPLDLASEQVACTIKRFAGPMGASAVQPYALDEFDASMSVHKLAQMIGTNLKRDFDKWLDACLVALYDICSSALYPIGMSAVNDATTADAFPLDLDTIFRAEETLDSANIPRFSNGRRMFVGTPRQIRELKSDEQFAKLCVPHSSVNPLFQSYVGTVGSVDIHVSNTLAQTVNSSSVAIQYGQMFGPGKVGLGAGGLPRVLHSTDDNYGLQSKVIWEWKAGMVNLDNRFGVSVRST